MFVKTYKIVQPELIEEYLQPIEDSEELSLVRVDKLAICKADIRYFLGKRAQSVLAKKYPLIPIHEAVGTVVKDPTHTYKKGDKVILIPNSIDESKCRTCTQTKCMDKDIQQNYCPYAKFASSSSDGFLRPFMAMSPKSLVKYNPNVKDEYAVFSELLSVANAALRRVDLTKEDNIAIWGDGIMAYMVYVIIADVLDLPVSVIGMHKGKLQCFKKAKIYTTEELDESFHNFTVLFEAVGGKGSESAVNQMIGQSSIGAQLILMGVSEDKILVDSRRVLEKGLTLKGVTRSSIEDFQKVSNYLDNEEVIKSLKPLVLSVQNINSANDVYHTFLKEIENTEIIGKNIMGF